MGGKKDEIRRGKTKGVAYDRVDNKRDFALRSASVEEPEQQQRTQRGRCHGPHSSFLR